MPQQPTAETLKFPYPENLTYRVEWRMVTAGNATIKQTRGSQGSWQTDLDVTSAGFVNRLFRVQDSYKLVTNENFCGSSLDFSSQEGKHHSLTTLAFDNEKHKLHAVVKDMVSGTSKQQDFDIPAACTYDIVGALMNLRTMPFVPGAKTSFPVTDGKKLVNVRIEALNKEKITVDGRSYNAGRYEAFVFDNVLYRRKGRLFIWMTDDAQRLPVQMRFQLSFPIGDVNLALEKEEKL